MKNMLFVFFFIAAMVSSGVLHANSFSTEAFRENSSVDSNFELKFDAIEKEDGWASCNSPVDPANKDVFKCGVCSIACHMGKAAKCKPAFITGYYKDTCDGPHCQCE